MSPYRTEVPCRDGLGRDSLTVISLDPASGDATVIAPTPSGRYDTQQLDELIAALEFARGLRRGGRR